MKSQPNRDYVSNDDVQTPLELARRLVAHFRPSGRILEPCCGEGNFLQALRGFTRSGVISEQRSAIGTTDLTDSKHPALRDKSRVARGTPPRDRAIARSLRRQCRLAVKLRLGSSRPSRVAWCEVKRGRDFFAWREPVDWIFTNPPWSQFRPFLQHALALSEHVVFLVTINHLWTRARIRDIRTAGFGIREIVMVDMPATFPQLGFQLGAVHLQRGWSGPITLTDWTAASPQLSDHGSKLLAARSALVAVPLAAPKTSRRRVAESAAASPRRRVKTRPPSLSLLPELLRKYRRK